MYRVLLKTPTCFCVPFDQIFDFKNTLIFVIWAIFVFFGLLVQTLRKKVQISNSWPKGAQKQNKTKGARVNLTFSVAPQCAVHVFFIIALWSKGCLFFNRAFFTDKMGLKIFVLLNATIFAFITYGKNRFYSLKKLFSKYFTAHLGCY